MDLDGLGWLELDGQTDGLGWMVWDKWTERDRLMDWDRWINLNELLNQTVWKTDNWPVWINGMGWMELDGWYLTLYSTYMDD